MTSELPRRFEVVHKDRKSYYIVDLDEGCLYSSPKSRYYGENKTSRWPGYTERQVRKYIKDGVWKIVDVFPNDSIVEVGDLL